MTDTLVLKNTKFTKGLVMPKKGTYLELEQDEMEYVDGGGRLRIGLTFTWGAVISSSIIGTIVGFCTGYMTTKTTKLGVMLGGFWGGVAGFKLGGIVSSGIASILNSVLHSVKSLRIVADLIDTNWAGPNFSYYYDIGNLFSIIGHIGGFGGGAAIAIATSIGCAKGLVA